MEVKVYREPENENLIMDENSLMEYNKIALELGLQTKENAVEEKTPNIYIALNQTMQRQLKAVCPASTSIGTYKKSTIPLEVLKVYKYAKDNEMFDGFQIWYNDKEPDPLLIGWKWMNEEAKKNDYTWQRDRFLMARWGDCALELNDLLELGFQKTKQQLIDKLSVSLANCKIMLDSPDVYARKVINGESVGNDINISLDSQGTIY